MRKTPTRPLSTSSSRRALLHTSYGRTYGYANALVSWPRRTNHDRSRCRHDTVSSFSSLHTHTIFSGSPHTKSERSAVMQCVSRALLLPLHVHLGNTPRCTHSDPSGLWLCGTMPGHVSDGSRMTPDQPVCPSLLRLSPTTRRLWRWICHAGGLRRGGLDLG